MKHILLVIALLLPIVNLTSAIAKSIEATKAQVMMLGVFHFSSPGKDTVKIRHLDVMAPESQQYLQKLSAAIVKDYNPTLVLVEYNPKNDPAVQAKYKQYLQGNLELPVNEIYQLGFRVAKAAGNVPIATFDDRAIGWDAERLFETMPTSAPTLQKAFDEKINHFTEQGNKDHQALSLSELLLKHNDPKFDQQNKALYLLTNSVSTDGEFEGARAASSWWHRNFRMYAKIQQFAQPNERILVIGGQGHTAILKDFLALDEHIQAIDVRKFIN
ncbi:DUF5694 domain-containing protein [Thalassotalea atypica]|uniref:DUF5694 domain-containing protein n=1 Tax=Thalassotalea atypica TaxID=2054316 RepID=UPI0025744BB0|nr:DUF5694 domain-containing protein [Thalassotalea atypica]